MEKERVESLDEALFVSLNAFGYIESDSRVLELIVLFLNHILLMDLDLEFVSCFAEEYGARDYVIKMGKENLLNEMRMSGEANNLTPKEIIKNYSVHFLESGIISKSMESPSRI